MGTITLVIVACVCTLVVSLIWAVALNSKIELLQGALDNVIKMVERVPTGPVGPQGMKGDPGLTSSEKEKWMYICRLWTNNDCYRKIMSLSQIEKLK